MSKKENTGNQFIYCRATDEKIPAEKRFADEVFKEATRIRKREQYYGRCECPRSKIWSCDGDCLVCPYHRAGNMLSYNAEINDDGETFIDSMADSLSVEDIVTDAIILGQLMEKFRELCPDADLIVERRLEGRSDRAIAKELNIPQKTFSDRMARIKKELHKILGE